MCFIKNYFETNHLCSAEEVGRQLNYCVRDGLLVLTKRVGNKGSKVGVETEGYKLPEEKVCWSKLIKLLCFSYLKCLFID